MDLTKIASRLVNSKVRTAGRVEFIRDQGPIRRDIRTPGFKWSPEVKQHLAKVLWAIQRSHTYSMAAHRIFSKLNSSEFSPDGLLGGRGYIQSIKDMRNELSKASEVLSSFSDTIQDELSADHWKDVGEDPITNDLVQDAENIKSSPDEFVENEYDSIDSDDTSYDDTPVENPDPNDYNPDFDSYDDVGGEESEESDSDSSDGQTQLASLVAPISDRPNFCSREKKNKEKKTDKIEKPGSLLPTDKSEQGQGKTESEMTMHTTTLDHGSYASSFDNSMNKVLTLKGIHTAAMRIADSSLPVETLPGPRVRHIGPGDGNDAGNFNEIDEMWASDDPSGECLSSGVNESNPIYEDAYADGVSPYADPTEGDNTVLSVSSRIARDNYSWLPGSRNEKNMNYYDRNLTDSDIEWMRDHSDPDPPAGWGDNVDKSNIRKELWDVKI